MQQGAYAVIWLITIVTVFLVWRRQRSMGRRLDALERAFEKTTEDPDVADERMMKTVVKDHPKRADD